MYSYREYPIRCESCGEQLASYAEEYEKLVKDFSIEESLNKLGIMEPCSRINMMNPVIRIHNKENRNLIEGSKEIEEISPFDSCEKSPLSKMKKVETVEPLKKSVEKPPVQGSRIPITAGKTSSKGKKSEQKTQRKKVVLNRPTRENVVSEQEKQPRVEEVEELDEIGKFTQLKDSEVEIDNEFILPTRVGIPTINPTMTKNDTVHISGKYYVEVLSGRTYLAR